MDDHQGAPQDKYYRFDADDEIVKLFSLGQDTIISLIEQGYLEINEIQPNGYTLLQIAAYEGCTNVVKFLMDQGADVHLRAYSDETALHLACDRGHEVIAKMLLIRPSQVKETDVWSNTVLHFAARGGNESIVELLLDLQVLDINMENEDYKTALHLACEEGQEDVVKLLINRGANVHAKNCISYSALQGAVNGKNKSIVELVLNKGIDLNIEIFNFEKSLRSACCSGCVDIVKLLFEYGLNINVEKFLFRKLINSAACDKSIFEYIVNLLIDQGIDVIPVKVFKQCLSVACLYGHEDIARELFHRLPKADVKDKTILRNAVRGGNKSILQLTLSQGIDVNAKTEFGESVLHLACEGGHRELVEILIDSGADLSAIDDTTLHFAIKGGNADIVRLILKHGFNVDLTKVYKGGLLEIACRGGHEEILKILLEDDNFIGTDAKRFWVRYGNYALLFAIEGKNINIVKLLLDQIEVYAINNKEESALHLACAQGSEDLVELLVERGANVLIGGDEKRRTVLHHAVLSENKNVVKFLLDRGVDVHSRDSDGNSALLLAVKLGNFELIELLLKYGAEITDKDNRGNSVYHIVANNLIVRPKYLACDKKVPTVLKVNRTVKLFLKLGLDINSIDNCGETPLHAVSGRAYDFGMVKLFLNFGADIFAKNNKGETALKLACDLGLVSTAKLLLNLGADVEAKDNRGVTILGCLAKFDFCNRNTIVKLLLHYGANANVCGDHCRPALFSAVAKGSKELIELFLENGANVNPTNAYFRALPFVVASENTTAVQLLLDYGADLNLNSAHVQTTIQEAIALCVDPYDESGDIRCAGIVTRHVVVLKAANGNACEKIFKYIDGNVTLKDFKVQCEREIEKMKSDESCVPFWKILRSNHRYLANIARNEETVQFLASEEFQLEYPIYSSVLRDQMRRGIWRKILLDKVKNFFKAVGEVEDNGLPILPDPCADEIFSYLSNRDLRNLIRVCDPHNYFDLDLCDIKIPT